MFAFTKGANNTAIYDQVSQKLQIGNDKLRAAIEMDELTKISGTLNEKLRTAELYKEARVLLKEANEFNIMDIPESKRSEILEKRTKARKLERSAQERLIKICNEVDPKTHIQPKSAAIRPTTSSSARVTPRDTRSTVAGQINTSKENQNNENHHLCSRGNRCGSHNPPAKKSVAVRSQLQVSNRRLENKKALEGALPIHRNPVNRTALLKGVDKVIGERLLDEILDNTGVHMEDVAGCQSAKAALEEAVIFPALNPNLFSGLRQPVKGILLFGPPGNGKTLLAKAVAGDSNQMFFNISASSLTSKWVGDSEKTIRGLFQIARNGQPSIIFIDEIDSILCERSEKDAEVSRRMKTEFLVQFDGATSSPDDRILVIGATNRPHEIDDAVLRRFPKRILLNLPEKEARRELITKLLEKHNMMDGLTTSDIKRIAANTHGFSNSDLVALCKEAAMVPIREIDKSKLYMTDGNKLRKITSSDFDTALRSIRPSTSDKTMFQLNKFYENYGS